MGETLVVLIIFGLLIFLVSRSGHGLGCCGGHSHGAGNKSEDKTNGETKTKKGCH